jgi:hypothetical protein
MAEGVDRFEKPTYVRNAPMQPNPGGFWVRYSDYEKLEAEFKDWPHWKQTLERDIRKLEAQRDQARQEVLEEVAAEFEKRATIQHDLAVECLEREGKLAHLGLEDGLTMAAAHCRSLATLDPSGEATAKEELTMIALALYNQGIEDCTPERGVELLIERLYAQRKEAPSFDRLLADASLHSHVADRCGLADGTVEEVLREVAAATQPVSDPSGEQQGEEEREAVELAWDESGRSALDEMFEAITPRDGSEGDPFTAAMLAPHAWAEIKRLRSTPATDTSKEERERG